MTQQPIRHPLPTALMKRINRLAHADAQRHEGAMRQRLIDDLQRLRAEGTGFQGLDDHLRKLEGVE